MRKIIQTMLLVTLLVTGFCLVPPVSAQPPGGTYTSQISFNYTWEEETGTEIRFYFYFDVTTTRPVLLFGGTEPLYIDLQPSRTRFRIELMMNGFDYWDETFDGEAPVGKGTFRISTPDLSLYGIEAFLIGVEATTYVKYSATGRLIAGGTLEWDEAGKKSFDVRAPFGFGSEDIKAVWYYKWKVRFGMDLMGMGDIFNEWNEMDDLKGTTQNIDIGYGYGFIFVGLIVIVATPVVLLIRRRRKPKPELKQKLEPIQEPKLLEINCRSCGKPISSASEYCNFCGTKVEEEAGF